MKIPISFPFRATLVTVLSLMLADQLPAQTFKTLHGFTDGSDAGGPQDDLLLLGDTLYGTTQSGGDFSLGTIFALSPDGKGFTNLYSFTGASDGANPGHASLVVSGTTLFGTAQNGGDSGNGTVFAINTDGNGFTNLYSFTGTDGANPYAGLILLTNTLFGTTHGGGTSGSGTVFAIHVDGSGFTNFYSFSGGTDGANPWGGLVFSNNTLYGTTSAGGLSGNGSVFAVRTDGAGFTTLYGFTNTSDGAGLFGGLILSGNTLYGTAARGGSFGKGAVFKLETDGSHFTVLHSFTGNNDGGGPHCRLFLAGNTLYGTAGTGGSSGSGTAFKVSTDGTGFSVLHNFTSGTDGASPYGGLISGGIALYGTTITSGGGTGTLTYGTVFKISLPVISPQLTITPSGQNSILTWPTIATSFTLQFTTNLASPVWTTNLAAPVVVNGLYKFTNSISAQQQFFRLAQ